jgi:toxin ParE1/3/4
MKFRLTRPALRDLAEIGRHTREHWSYEQARRYGTAIAARLKWLCHNQPLWHERPELAEGLFSYPHQSHVIIFRTYRDGIEILRILHQRMDPARHLRDNAHDPPGQ